MLQSLQLKNVGPTPAAALNFGSRLNVFTGDNGLGKSFLLDILWFILTRAWPAEINPNLTSGFPARPHQIGHSASINFEIKSTKTLKDTYQYRDGVWTRKSGRPHMPGVVVYAHIDGSFSVWDPMKNYWRDENEEGTAPRPRAFVFSPHDVWQGLGSHGTRYCNGLLQDVYDWQKDDDWKIDLFNKTLAILSPADCPLKLGTPAKISVMDARKAPTIVMPYGEVSVQLASAGIRRILALAYFLTWTWTEHIESSQLRGRTPTSQLTFLMDEVEAHLHPKWQRKIMDSLMTFSREPFSQVQYFLSTHSPLVMGALEPVFSAEKDQWFDLQLKEDNNVQITPETFEKKGDVNQWLQSEAFDLESTYSLPAAEAMRYMRKLVNTPANDADAIKKQYQTLLNVLPIHDPFLLRLRAVCDAKGIALR